MAMIACGGDDDGSGSGNGDDDGGGNGGAGAGMGTGGMGAGTPGCGTPEAPTLLTLSELNPPIGAVIPATGVVHTFTTSNAPGIVDMVTFLFGAPHTAGTPDGMFSFTIQDNMNGTYTYNAAAVDWPMAGHVEFSVQEVFTFPNSSCYYAFPNPLFSYDVTL